MFRCCQISTRQATQNDEFLVAMSSFEDVTPRGIIASPSLMKFKSEVGETPSPSTETAADSPSSLPDMAATTDRFPADELSEVKLAPETPSPETPRMEPSTTQPPPAKEVVPPIKPSPPRLPLSLIVTPRSTGSLEGSVWSDMVFPLQPSPDSFIHVYEKRAKRSARSKSPRQNETTSPPTPPSRQDSH
eukprot:Gregarina_sp_Poly_1__441@NODE_1107_length_5080_cov_147_992021_g767_i0_p4_GENE_NODE_1107_length_5080_cov_147_992021_g767_i0NODE_1107_length_5080_cov_147_992021_g767_i0_p4_ORF_typecomplete_len189_score49_06_NODE_1107_length_5080_cov_147_992021_g767_i031853751